MAQTTCFAARDHRHPRDEESAVCHMLQTPDTDRLYRCGCERTHPHQCWGTRQLHLQYERRVSLRTHRLADAIATLFRNLSMRYQASRLRACEIHTFAIRSLGRALECGEPNSDPYDCDVALHGAICLHQLDSPVTQRAKKRGSHDEKNLQPPQLFRVELTRPGILSAAVSLPRIHGSGGHSLRPGACKSCAVATVHATS